MTPAAIHHQVKSLEENLGVSLFTRSGNNLALTQAAAAVLPTLEGAFDLLSLVTEQLKQYTKEGMLRIATCPAFGQKWLVPRLLTLKMTFHRSICESRTSTACPSCRTRRSTLLFSTAVLNP